MSRTTMDVYLGGGRNDLSLGRRLARLAAFGLPLLAALVAFLGGAAPAAAQFTVQGCQEVWTGDPGSLGTTRSCYTAQNLRSVYPLTDCPPGEEKNGALCYPLCRAGYTGNGPLCWQSCPQGFVDDGATCRRPAMILSANNTACPWYDKCGLTLARGCSKCPAGYQNDGCTCRIDVSVFGKDSYGRGLGDSLICSPGREQIGALCYGSCPAGFHNDGIHCTANQQTCVDVPNQPPAPPQNRYCFIRRQASTVDPCRPVEQYASSEANAMQLLQNCNCSNCTFESASCGTFLNACTPPPMPPAMMPPPTTSPAPEQQ